MMSHESNSVEAVIQETTLQNGKPSEGVGADKVEI
jgi:hypothetical protein